MNRQKFKQTIPYLLLGMFTLFFAGFFAEDMVYLARR